MFDSIDKKSDALKKLEKELAKITKQSVYVGFNEKSGAYDDGVTIAQIATFQQFGTSTIPARPFLTDTLEHRRDEIMQLMQDGIAQVKAGTQNAEQMLNTIGVAVKGMVQEEITDGDFVPNAPSTVKKKGSDKPLIDTGRMRQSVVYEVK